MNWARKEIIGDATLYLGDCTEILPLLGRREAIVCDPPYGQNLNVNVVRRGGTSAAAIVQRNGSRLKIRESAYPSIHGDDSPFDPTHLLEAADQCLLWGAHKFSDKLPAGQWLVWDKVPTGKVRDQGDGEAAWLNADRPMRIFRLLWDGVCVGASARHEITAGTSRVHPTQKPEALMRWCIDQLRPDPETITDPYMGSGSTGFAAIQMGRKFIGIEIDEAYFDTACRRIAKAWEQGKLVLPSREPKQKTGDLFTDFAP